jgi:DNA polymerase-3 subunit gamma/tau
MNDLILYQQYRPQKFTDLIARESVSKVLMNEILNKNIANAYIFFGNKGTGKTSIARIFSKAINCLDLEKNGDPCNKCVNCVAINNSNFMDLLEIDAASNRGIDDIRELKDKIQFAPVMGKYKIYIIDEVHMLTKDAFNALLKTLEEPPKNVVFILATTEINKVPETIISRCQRFDFLNASYQDLSDQLNKVIKLEKIKIDDSIKELIITVADGSFRDTMTNLQKVLAIYSENLTYKDVVTILNFPDIEFIKIIWKDLFEGNLDTILDNFEKNTINIISFIKNSLDFIKKVLVNRILSKKYYDIDDEIFENISTQKILNIVNILIKTLDDIRVSSSDLVCLEISFIFMMQDLNIEYKAPVQNKSKSLETKIDLKKTVLITEDNILSVKLRNNWTEIIEKSKVFNHHMSGFLSKSAFSFDDKKLIIIVPFAFYRDMLIEVKSKEYLSSLIKEVIGDDFVLDCIVDKKVKPIVSVSQQKNVDEDDIKELFEIDS